ncbi:glycosyltransferase family 4 protein [Liquorilactobacillus hordei]|uniref:glycosyltransferase family 4 protein n=1 Tax=Liquorilactobacillus hordei TaxID=468911 RepID=UPI000710C7D8|nr:glycosyltransferase family 4 protein [Liquorilactobacillus hordei]QYH52200.1 glycosyltransferase family 4 protein [Liquorilactobacillus hordei DSM 19519]
MKILHICLTGPYTENLNYQENMLTKFQSENTNDRVYVIASQFFWNREGKVEKTLKKTYINGNGVKVFRLSIKKFKNKNVFFRYKLFNDFENTVNSISPDIIFVHNLQFFDILKLIKYKKRNTNCRIIVDNHSDFSNSARNFISKLFYLIVWRYIAKRINPYVEKFYGVLPARVDFLENIYGLPQKKCELLLMGADDEKVLEAQDPKERLNIRMKYGIDDNDFLIITGGKIDMWKKQTLFLMDAVASINNPKIKLIVFGSVSPDLKEDVRKRCIEHKIQYIGWLDAGDSYKYFASADLVVFPGRHSVFWEQVVGQGIPMICKYWEGTTHIDLGGNVLFIKEDSINEIASCIKKVINDNQLYKRMKTVAVDKGMKSFSYKKISDKSLS